MRRSGWGEDLGLPRTTQPSQGPIRGSTKSSENIRIRGLK
jgi:hypothetical protein